MLGKIIVRDDIVYLQDDPVIEPGLIDRNLSILGDTLRETGLRRLLVHGASQTDRIDEAATVWLTNRLTRNIPGDTRIAFAHAGESAVAEMAEHVVRLLGEAGIAATAVFTTRQAEDWLRENTIDAGGSRRI